MKLGLNMAQQYNGMMSNMVNALQEAEIASVEAKYDAEISAAKANGQETAALEAQKEAEIYEIRKKYAGMQFAVKISEIIANTSVAIMQAYAQLGPIGGSIAAAMLTVTGAAQLALAKAEYDKVMSSGGGGSKKSAASVGKTKLVSGMLTYDKGNVDRFGGRRKLYDDGETQVYGRKHRYVGDDGRVYTATDEPSPRTGLVTRPIATTVQGQPALVAERGPEIVIGRETTQAIMMNEPELLQHLIDIDRNRSLAGSYSAMAARAAFDEGNVGSMAAGSVSGGTASETAAPDASASGDTADRETRLAAALEQSNAALRENAAALLAVREQLKQPVHINMYGESGLRQSLRKADRTMSRYDG